MIDLASMRLAATMVSACLMAGCSTLSPPVAPRVDGAFAGSVRAAFAQQVARPGANAGERSTGEFDAQAARSALNRHRDSFKAPPPSFTILGIGSSVRGGGQ